MNAGRCFFVLLLAAALALAGCDKRAFRTTDITGAGFARGFALTDHSGKTRTLADYKGKVVAIFFGYTQCPDICPTALAQFAAVMKALDGDADRVQILFVTVDPERDTPELLAKYVPAFDPRFVGLYGDKDATAATAKEFKVIVQKQAGKTPDTYTVDHSAGIYIFDPAGKVRLFARHDQPLEDLTADIKLLLRG